MNDLQIINNLEFGEIRIVDVDGKPYFVGIDIAKALGYKKPKAAQDMQIKVNRATEALNKTEKELRETEAALDGFGKGSESAAKDAEKLKAHNEALAKSMKTLAAGAVTATVEMAKLAVKGIAAATGAVSALAGIGVKYNADMEEYTTNFSTMLGSQEAAVKKVDELKKMAAATPFGMADLAKGTETLLAFGIESDKTKETLRQIGDVSLGNKEKFNGLTLVFSQMSATGKLMGQDLNQMINAGFNPLQEISRTTGKSIGELKEEMSKGAITTEMVAAAFKSATDEGGKFYNGMEAASKTLSGQMSTLKDNVMSLLGEISEGLSKELALDVAPMALNAVEQMQTAFREKGIPGLAQAFGDVFAAAVSEVASYVPQAAQLGVQFIQAMARGLYDNRHEIIKAASDIGGAILTAIFGDDIKKHWDKFSADTVAMMRNFANTVVPVLKPVGAVLEGTFKFVLNNGPLIASTIAGIGAAMASLSAVSAVSALSKSWQVLTTSIIANGVAVNGNAAAQAAAIIIMKAKGAVALVLAGELSIAQAATSMLTAAQTALNLVTAAYPGAVLAVAIGAVVGGLLLLGNSIIAGITSGVMSAAGSLTNAVVSAARSAMEATKDYLGIHSPSARMRDEVGLMIGYGMAEGIQASAARVNAAMAGLERMICKELQISHQKWHKK